ncbi:MAG: FkbM family methyltransferase [Oligoflexales bacterium]
MFLYLASKVHRFVDFACDVHYRKAVLSRAILFLLRKINSDVQYVGVNVNGEKTFLFTRDEAVTPYTIAMGGFQKEDLLYVISLLQKNYNLKKNGIFFDIGANIGTQTIYALHSKLFQRAFCFEPVQSNIDMLKLNLFANNLLPAAEVVPVALSDSEGESEIVLSSVNCGDHRVVAGAASTGNGETQKIKCLTLDGYLSKQGIKPTDVSLVWIDTQGHEGQVLTGAQSVLAHNIPVVMEFWPWALRNAGGYEKILDIIKKHFRYFYDLTHEREKRRETANIAQYAASLSKAELFATDLLLVK